MPEPVDVTIPEAVDAFLQHHSRTFLLTLRKDGSPTGHPLTGYYSDGFIYLDTYRKSAKVRNLVRDRRVCCLVTTWFDDPDFQAVLFRGTARIVDSNSLPQRFRSPEGSALAKRHLEGRRIIIRVDPERVGFLNELRGG